MLRPLSDAPPFVTDDVGKVAAAIAGNPTGWALANWLILSAALITAVGLVPISLRFTDQSRSWAVGGLVAFTIGATLEVVNGFIAIGVTTWAAQLYPNPTAVAIHEAFNRFGSGLGATFAILGFTAIGLIGNAIRKDESATKIGSAFIIGAGVGILLEAIGVGIPGFVYLGTGALGITAWRLTDTPMGI